MDLAPLRRARRVDYEVRANWKLLLENFAESHHFPFVHPSLEHWTPSRLAASIPSGGPWQGGTMDIIEGAETVSQDGLRHGRATLPGMPDERRVLDYLVWPGLLLSIQPDYMLVYQVLPLEERRTQVVAEIHLAAESYEAGPPGIQDLVLFWDRTNQEDVEACERQQRGVESPGFQRARYAPSEDGMHRFDRMVADAYLASHQPASFDG
jgi:Rieske 2Fe-2S family protein